MEIFTGILGFILGLVALALAVSWLIFPWLAINSLNKILAQLKAGNATLDELRTFVKRLAQTQSALDTVPPAPTQEACYFFALEGETKGPFTRQQLETSLQRGLIEAKTPVLREGEKSWSTIGETFSLA